MKRRLLVGSIALFLTGTSAVVTASAGQVFECRDASGKVAYSTVPCGAQAQPASPEAGAPNYETFYGPWHGQTQFRETVAGGGTDALAHLITPLILTIE